jgi:hypothetical protein
MAVNGIGADTGRAANGTNAKLKTQISTQWCRPQQRQWMRAMRCCHLPMRWTMPCLRGESHQQATNVPGTPVWHFQPLANADGRVDWRAWTRTELCNVAIHVDSLLDGNDCPLSTGHLPGGTAAAQAVAKKDRLADTSWILPMSHLACPAEALSS